MEHIVVFGGTFNPIHLGHVEIIKQVAALGGVTQVMIIPARVPPHKVCTDLACDADRLEMCRIAVADIEKVVVSDIELLREGKSYTVDTLKRIKRENPSAKLSLVVGGDMVVTFTEWYRYDEILDIADIIAVRRVGIDNDLFDTAVKNLINMDGRINVLKNTILGISSTEIKQNINNDAFLKAYLHEGVIEYIKQNGLYNGEIYGL
ncbi:MAG: nicotinate (nicotinamide) nucleotide adenylyltransferase [Ruminococcaceae bacterium]|nr:nicotinate (nicotinamide) nucleotide adenylyltransferase [Oscillospiraceae bacterium]